MNRIVLGVLIDNDKVLVSKVHKDHLEKFNGSEYVFPGGMVEVGESDEEAIQRELKEETGYDVEVLGQISFWISPDTNEEVYTYHCNSNDVHKPFAINNSNTESLHWFTLEEVDQNYPYMNPDVKRYLIYAINQREPQSTEQ